MSEDIFRGSVTVTSYCGPATTEEHTRMRLQFLVRGEVVMPHASYGYSDVQSLYSALGDWLEEHAPAGKDNGWVKVHDDVAQHTVRRIAVPNGWLYQVARDADDTEWSDPVFVADRKEP